MGTIPAKNTKAWFAKSPIRMVWPSPGTPSFPMSMLSSPVVRLKPAWEPTAMLKLPVVLF